VTALSLHEAQVLGERCTLGLLTRTGGTVTTPSLWMRHAGLDDIDTILRWRVETAANLHERYGTDLWGVPYPAWKLQNWVKRGSMWMALPDPIAGVPPVGTLTLDPEPEPGTDFWTPEEQETPAWYLSKLNRSQAPELRGQNIGQVLLNWALTQASLAGIGELRFDCWTTNHRLRGWYEDQGAELVRVVEGVNSGACYRLATRVMDTPVAMLPGVVSPSLAAKGSEAEHTP
jgi:GNAT superfamily N-acetyltransferase